MVDGRAGDEWTGGPRSRGGRDREHLFPGRVRRINPSFTAGEYAEVVAAARRVGLTPTGFCAVAALAAARGGHGVGPPADAGCELLAQVQVELFDARTAVVRTGTNLNQAVTMLHATGEAPVWLRHAATRCMRSLAGLDAAVAAVHRRLP